ncbi:MAG: glycosyltransferase family 1 protein, partial [Bacteroidales bacterium]
ADTIIAISNSTKNDIVNLFGIKPDKIEVVYQTCDDIYKKKLTHYEAEAILRRYELPPHYLLYVGTINRRKNLLTLVKAMHILNKQRTIPLVVVGNGGRYKQEIEEYIKKNNLGSTIIFFSQFSNYDLPALYTNAEIFIYPSLYEGFGIPILEAQFCNVPVITSSLSSLPEAAGEGALFCDVENPEAIYHAINSILNNKELRNNLINKGITNCTKFNSEVICSSIMNVYYKTIDK